MSIGLMILLIDLRHEFCSNISMIYDFNVGFEDLEKCQLIPSIN